jgi:hypothetical protein
MKTRFILKLLLITFLHFSKVNAQVGINTVTPNATLDVVGKPATITELDGIIPPRITGNQLQAKTYTNAQNGALVYVTSAATSPLGQTINVNAAGLYFFNTYLNQWISLTSNSSIKNIFCNNNDPNIATVFDDELPTVSNDSTLIQNDQYTYFGLDGSVWIWNGSAYVSYNINANLSVGQRISSYKTMAVSAANGTHLPASGLIELDGLVRIGLNKYDNTFYKPYILNISSNPIKVTFASGFRGATAENRYAVQISISAGLNQGLDNNDITYWTTGITEILTADIILPNGKWYEIQWIAYELNSIKHIYMTATRKF